MLNSTLDELDDVAAAEGAVGAAVAGAVGAGDGKSHPTRQQVVRVVDAV